MTLLINCCARQESRTNRLVRALLKKLGSYEELRLYDEPLLPLNEERLLRRDALLARKEYGADMFRYARQFAAAECIVIAAPLWDLSVPAMLKIYLENIYVTGIMTKYDDSGRSVGLCRARKLYFVSTSGGPYDSRYGFDYLKSMATECFGIPEVQLIRAENLDIAGSNPEDTLQAAIAAYGLSEK